MILKCGQHVEFSACKFKQGPVVTENFIRQFGGIQSGKIIMREPVSGCKMVTIQRIDRYEIILVKFPVFIEESVAVIAQTFQYCEGAFLVIRK